MRSLAECVEIGGQIKIPHLLVFSKIEGMVGVALAGALARAEPARAVRFSDRRHIPHTVRQIGPLFDDGAPGRPDGGAVACADV